MFGFTFARSNLASVRSEYNLLFAFLIVMSSQCSALSFVFTLSSALSHRLTRPWTCRNKLGPGWLDLLRLRKKMLNESNTPALLNSVVTLWDVFVMFSKSNFWGEICLSCSPAVCPLVGLRSCCYVWMSSPYLLSELQKILEFSQLTAFHILYYTTPLAG